MRGQKMCMVNNYHEVYTPYGNYSLRKLTRMVYMYIYVLKSYLRNCYSVMDVDPKKLQQHILPVTLIASDSRSRYSSDN